MQSKKQPKRYEERDKADAIAASKAAEQDQPLDDPVLEKLRQQRWVLGLPVLTGNMPHAASLILAAACERGVSLLLAVYLKPSCHGTCRGWHVRSLC